jgi:hypothetical protein
MSEGEAITEGVSSLPSGSCMYSHAETALEDCFNLELSVAIVETEADEIDRVFSDVLGIASNVSPNNSQKSKIE